MGLSSWKSYAYIRKTNTDCKVYLERSKPVQSHKLHVKYSVLLHGSLVGT